MNTLYKSPIVNEAKQAQFSFFLDTTLKNL
jgi:hypothetical protein